MLGALIAFTMMGTVASQVTATATIINMLGNEIGISYEAGAIIACLVFIIYTATSGLFGVIYTDVFQFVSVTPCISCKYIKRYALLIKYTKSLQ